MTATAAPEWEAKSRQHRELPLADETSARDPGYVYARLQEALRQAREFAEEYGDSSLEDRNGYELAMLRRCVEDLAAQMRLYSPAADEFLTVLQAVASELTWRRGTSFSGAVFGANREQQALQCHSDGSPTRNL